MLQQPKIISANKPFTADKEYVYIMAQNGHQEQNERGGEGERKEHTTIHVIPSTLSVHQWRIGHSCMTNNLEKEDFVYVSN